MKQGLVIGKFMPLHRGHVALINFAAEQCDRLIVHLDAKGGKPIPTAVRVEWLKETFKDNDCISISCNEEELPDAPYPSPSVSKVWADYLSARYPSVNVFISSEQYGEYVAEYMGIDHVPFDPDRSRVAISATMIREDPLKYWDYLPGAVRPYYLKRVCIYGPESTGKTVLTEDLARHYGTVFVPEMAREVLGERHVDTLVYEDIPAIAEAHAREITSQSRKADRILFVDTDIITTRIYSEHYFGRVPAFDEWIVEANRFDLYIYCDIDVPWIEDRHRNSGHLREQFRECFLRKLDDRGLPYRIISGSWDERFAAACAAVDKVVILPHTTD